MKKLLLKILIVLLMAGVSQAKNWNAWLIGDNDSVTARLGYDVNANIEFGGELTWLDKDSMCGTTGIYGIYKFPDAVQIPNPIPLDFLPKTLTASPYLGAQVGIDILNRGSFVGPVAGVVIQNVLTIEWQYLGANFQFDPVDNEQRILLGLNFRF